MQELDTSTSPYGWENAVDCNIGSTNRLSRDIVWRYNSMQELDTSNSLYGWGNTVDFIAYWS